MRKSLILVLSFSLIIFYSCASINVYEEEQSQSTVSDSLYPPYFDISIVTPNLLTMNSVGGVGWYTYIFNHTQKTIKYLYISIIPYNAVNDAQSCSIRNQYQITCEVTGPLEPNTGQHYGWDCLWYNSTIRYARITGIYIKYTDGSVKSSNGYDLNKIIVENNKIEIDNNFKN